MKLFITHWNVNFISLNILLSFPLIDGSSSVAHQQIQHTDKNWPIPLPLAIRWGRCPTTGYPCWFRARGWLLSGHYRNHLTELSTLCLRVGLWKKLTLSGQFSLVTTIVKLFYSKPWCAKKYIYIDIHVLLLPENLCCNFSITSNLNTPFGILASNIHM